MQFSYQGCILQFRAVRGGRKTQSCKPYQDICSKIFKCNEMFCAFAGFIGFYSQFDIFFIYFSSFEASMPYFSAANTAAFSSFFSQFFFCKLPEIALSDPCKDLVGRNITLDTLEPYPFRQDCFYVCNKFCCLFIRKSLIFPCFPEPV